jgi:DNA-binding MarR family transcriptional regulator
MNITTDMAELLLRHFIIRSKLLAPLGTISETCWLMMLHLFSSSGAEGQTVTTLADLMSMSEQSAARYVAVLEDAGFIMWRGELIEVDTRYQLTFETHEAIEDILKTMVQDVVLSLDK